MKRFILFLLAMEMAVCFGCASTRLVKGARLPEITNDDYSTVYVSRGPRVWGHFTAYTMLINDESLFQIASGDCVTFKIPTGQSEIDLFHERKQLRFISEKGKKYYFYVGSKVPELRQLTEGQWNEKQQSCDWVDLKE